MSERRHVIAMGNRCVAVPSERYPLLATDFYQILDTSDVPGGVVNIVAGFGPEAGAPLLEHKDVRALDQLLSSTLAYTDYDGSFMNKSEYMKWVAAPQQKADHLYDEGLNVQVYGEAAVATGIYRETGTNKGKAYVIRSRFTDTWIKRNDAWLCVASHSTLIPSK